MKSIKKIISLTMAIAVMCASFTLAPQVKAEDGDTVTVTADKTAQWTNQEKSADYDLRIHGWSQWETAAYIGFTLPRNFKTEGVNKAELIVNTVSANSSCEAYLYAAEYGAFTSGTQYEGTANAPSYTAAEIKTFTSPSTAGRFAINITDYIKNLAEGTSSAAFRIDVKSQDVNNAWVIGSLTNGSTAPKLVISYGEDDNMSFTSGLDKWTYTDGVTVVTESGTSFASLPSGGKISRVIEGLENGSYNLTMQTRRSDLNESCFAYAKVAGAPVYKTSVSGNNTWRKTMIQGITVTDGKCEIGFCGKGQLAEVSLEKADTPSRSEFLVGGDITEVSYVESRGGKYRDEEGNEADPIQLLAERGFNFARVRVYNDPGRGHGETASWQDSSGNTVSESYYLPEGFQNVEDGLSLTKRAKDKGMQVELTLYFSDYWADGARQLMPHEWAEEIEPLPDWNAKYNRLKELMYEYTKDVLLKMKAQNTIPEYISLGNEMQGGLLYDEANTYDYGRIKHFSNLAGLLNSAARAVREVAPDTKIVLHLDGKRSQYQSFFDNCRSNNVDYDIIGPSYYPFWTGDTVDTVIGFYNWLIDRYDKDVLVMETGYNFNPEKASGYPGQLSDNGPYDSVYPSSPNGQRAFMEEVFQGLRQVSGGRCIGDLYWDPMMINQDGVGWAMVEGKNGGEDYVGDNLVSNTTLFDFNGKALPAFDAYKNSGYTPNLMGIGGTLKGKDDEKLANAEFTLTANGKSYTVKTDKMGGYFTRIPYGESLTVSVNGAEEQPYTADMTKESLKTGLDFTLTSDLTQAITDFTVTKEGNSLSYSVTYTKASSTALYVALYDSEGKLLECQKDSGMGSFTLKNPTDTAGYKVKAFLWDNMTPIDTKEKSF